MDPAGQPAADGPDLVMMSTSDDFAIGFEAARKKAEALSYRLEKVCRASDKLLDCLNEFAPEYPQACAECAEYLDDVLDQAARAGEYDREAPFFERDGSR